MGCANSSDQSVNGRTSISENADDFYANYTLGAKLGEGGYSHVHEAFSKINKEKSAVKITEKIDSKGDRLKPEDEAAIKHEIDILKQLNHNHIVKFKGFFEDSARYYSVLEVLEGGELFDRIVQKQFYNEKEARDLVYIVLSAIKYCHDRNIVHRDLKPENLLMTSKSDDADVKIADFGFAKAANGLNLTTQCGSPGYVAPEILEKKPYGKPVDMWAIGVITFVLLGGYPPFHDDNTKKLFAKIKKAEFTFDDEYWGNVSVDAKNLISSLLLKDVKQRLTVDQALAHKWIQTDKKALEQRNLGANLDQFKKFHATRKFRAAARAVIAINKMAFNVKSNGDDIEDDDETESRPAANT